MSVRDELNKEYYEKVKLENAMKFSNFVFQRIGLEIDEQTGYLYCPDIIDYQSQKPLAFVFDGFKYVPFKKPYCDLAETRAEDTKLFDPYNNMALMQQCLGWFMVHQLGIDTNNEVLSMGISNRKMNDPGYAFIAYFNKPELDGHIYNRDCLKYMDLILMLDDGLIIEYDQLRRMDMESYDKFDFSKRPKVPRKKKEDE
jgi:hypothetical protein|nr:MAG TPA: hypothetical protein [Caudoviricetes sp.]